VGNEVYLAFKDITKTFPGVVANERVNLEVYKGEIHALLGENGAGRDFSLLHSSQQGSEGYAAISPYVSL
jgi:ABC-type uncharacterized transport system ATPase subunit